MLRGDGHEPSAVQLRWFGLIQAAFFGMVAGVAWRRWHAPIAASVLVAAALIVAAVYYTLPALRRPLLLAWRAATRPVERTVSFLALAFVYFAVITPVGLIMRLAGRDPLERRFEPARRSYFIRRRPSGNHARYFRQF